MDFTLSSDQQALREGVREFCNKRYGEDALRGFTAADASLWRDLGDLGVFGLTVPEADGGAGLGMAEAVLAFEELGRALVPGPLVASYLAAGVVEGTLEGAAAVGLVDESSDPLLVEHPDLIASLVVIGADGVHRIDAASVITELVASPMDPLTPVARVVGELPKGNSAGEVDDWRLRGALVTSAYQLGIAHAVTDRSVAYAKEREQFGRTIGSFQAIKHILADMFVRAELARAAVYAAGVTVDDPEVGDPARAVATAKLLADEAALLNTKAAIQVHGGMGFTWEVPLHLFLKRAWVLSTTFGTADEHALALASGV
jgi:alkylation response protein AidB-like acyl-CoA dehydrogenase